MTYLACSLIPLPEDEVEAYRSMAERMAEVWLDHGALAYRDYVGEDLEVAEQGPVPFDAMADLADDETLVLATLTFESGEHRDEVQAKVMEKDPRVGEIMGEGAPFDPSRMVHGGFELLVDG